MPKPVEFPGQTTIYAKDQPEYQPLPAHVTPKGIATSCWEFSDAEIQDIIKHRRIYVSQHTFNNPLQPISISTIFTGHN